MKINEIVLDWLGRTRLYEMTKSRADGRAILNNNGFNIAEHIVKLVIFGPRSRDFNHWCKEVDKWIKPINKLKVEPGHRRFEYAVLHNYLWKSWLETIGEIQEFMEDLEKEYRNTYSLEQPNPQEVHKIVKEIMDSVCYDLSKGNFISIRNYIQ